MMMGGGWITGLIFLLLFVLLVGGLVAVVIWMVARQSGSGSARQPQSLPAQADSREILRQRYARGEISRKEYLAMRDHLQS